MQVEAFESVILYVADLAETRAFYVDLLGLPVLFEDSIVMVVGNGPARIVLHRNDRGHDDRGIFPAGSEPGAAALRFAVADPDAWAAELTRQGHKVLWAVQDASWGRFLVAQDPDGRPVVLARMGSAADRTDAA